MAIQVERVKKDPLWPAMRRYHMVLDEELKNAVTMLTVLGTVGPVQPSTDYREMPEMLN